jgi:hypothetical protein
MTWLVLVVVLAAPCVHPEVEALPPERQDAACAYLAQPSAPGVERGPLAAIYERPGFERARLRNTGAMQALLAQLKHWFEGFAQTSGAQTYSNVTRVVVLALALLLGGALLLRFFTKKAPVVPLEARSFGPAPLELDDPAAHLARAEGLMANAPREAIREGLLALLSTLERRRFARPDRVKTNRELTEELSTRGAPAALIDQVSPLFGWFDRAFYSLEAVSDSEARRFLSDVKRLTEGT